MGFWLRGLEAPTTTERTMMSKCLLLFDINPPINLKRLPRATKTTTAREKPEFRRRSSCYTSDALHYRDRVLDGAQLDDTELSLTSGATTSRFTLPVTYYCLLCIYEKAHIS